MRINVSKCGPLLFQLLSLFFGEIFHVLYLNCFHFKFFHQTSLSNFCKIDLSLYDVFNFILECVNETLIHIFGMWNIFLSWIVKKIIVSAEWLVWRDFTVHAQFFFIHLVHFLDASISFFDKFSCYFGIISKNAFNFWTL